MKSDLKNIDQDSKYLASRLKRLQKQQTRIMPRNKKRTAPVNKGTFDRKTKKVKDVRHKIDYEPNFEKTSELTNFRENLKVDLELKACSFNPLLNHKSMAIALSATNTPIIQRGIPERYQKKLLDEKETLRREELEEGEAKTMMLPDLSGRKPDDQFYAQKVDWKNRANEKRENRRAEEETKIVATLGKKPEMNKMSKIIGEAKIGNEKS